MDSLEGAELPAVVELVVETALDCVIHKRLVLGGGGMVLLMSFRCGGCGEGTGSETLRLASQDQGL